MMYSRRRFLLISAFAATGVAIANHARSEHSIWTGHAMGADVKISLPLPKAQAAPLFAAIILNLRRIEGLFSLYDPNSQLSELNHVGRLQNPAPEMVELLALCDRLNKLTGGRFDPTVQPLWMAAASNLDTSTARKAVDWNRVQHSDDLIALQPGQALTLNGIAQGFATDIITAGLAKAGLQHALVNVGEYAALGGPWRLGVADPEFDIVAERVLQSSAIATSSPNAMRLADGEPHILDPRSTKQSPHWSTVSVEAENASIADGASTALCLATLDEAREIVAAIPELIRATFVDHDGAITELSRA